MSNKLNKKTKSIVLDAIYYAMASAIKDKYTPLIADIHAQVKALSDEALLKQTGFTTIECTNVINATSNLNVYVPQVKFGRENANSYLAINTFKHFVKPEGINIYNYRELSFSAFNDVRPIVKGFYIHYILGTDLESKAIKLRDALAVELDQLAENTASIESIIDSVTTVSKLLEILPEAKDYIPKPEPVSHGQLIPINLVADVRQILSAIPKAQ